MASLIHEISTHAYNKAKYLKSPGKDESGNPVEVVRITKKSERQYKDHAIKFGNWCKENYHCRHFDDCKPHIQDYADFLIKKGYSAGTIHTYLAAVCRVWNVAMDTIQKPVRHVAQNTRSRGIKASDSRKDAQREASPRLYDFASRVGLRRREYQKLSGGDLVEDKSNKAIKEFESAIRERFAPFVDFPIVYASALTKQRIFKVLESAAEVYQNRMMRIPTAKLNEEMLSVIENYPPPAHKGKYVKIKYVTQLKDTVVPTFIFFCNLPQWVKEPYKRFLENKIRSKWNFRGTPINIFMREK